jgi:hypothetical protein
MDLVKKIFLEVNVLDVMEPENYAKYMAAIMEIKTLTTNNLTTFFT